MVGSTSKSPPRRNPSVMIFIALLALFTMAVTLLSEGPWHRLRLDQLHGQDLGKTLCLCLIAIAMDLVWGYCGILSLGHFAFFGLGGYMIGMWLMYARTEDIVIASLAGAAFRRRAEEVTMPSARRSSAWWGSEIPVGLGLCRQPDPVDLGGAGARPSGAGVRLAGLPQPRDRRLSVDPDPGDDAGAVALSLPERFRPARQQRPFGPAEHSRPDRYAAIGAVGLVPSGPRRWRWVSATWFAAWVVSGKFGNVIRGIRDDEARVRFLGYPVEATSWSSSPLTAVIAASPARSTIRRRASSIRRKSRRSPRSTWRSGWPSAGAAGSMARSSARRFVSLLSTWFTGGRCPACGSAGLLHHRLGRLVAGAAGPRLRAGDAVCAQGHWRAV
jgi:urea transport system permease protein